MLQTDGHRVGAGGEVGEDADDGGGLLPNTEPVVADDPPKTDDDKVEAGSDPDGRWGRGSRGMLNVPYLAAISNLAWLLFETLKTTSI